MSTTHLTYAPIQLEHWLRSAHSPQTGAIVLFSGEVRDHHLGKDVSQISYEAHEPMAEAMMRDIINEAIVKFELQYAHALHRLGEVGISESAVLVITSHSHRKMAYQANEFIIDKIKAEVPIWKKEHYTDGTYYWGNQ